MAACLAVALAIGGLLLLSRSDDPPSVRTAAGAPGCAGKAYVADDVDGTVSAITTATGEVSSPITVGTSNIGPTPRVAITPDGKHAYVTNGGHNTVSVIDTATGAVSATIPVGNRPFGVAITPDGQHAYVTNIFDGTVSVIDTATGAVSAVIDVGAGPFGVAITPDGKQAYVTHAFASDSPETGAPENGTVSVIDTATGVVSASIDVGRTLSGVAITPDGKYAYVAGIDMFDMSAAPVPVRSTVSVIDTATGVVSATIPVGPGPSEVAITPDGKRAYVTGTGDYVTGTGDGTTSVTNGTVSVIDTATGLVSATITLGNRPDGVAITPDGKYAYVAGSVLSAAPDPLPIHGMVSVIDTATGAVSATIPVGSHAGGLAICPS